MVEEENSHFHNQAQVLPLKQTLILLGILIQVIDLTITLAFQLFSSVSNWKGEALIILGTLPIVISLLSLIRASIKRSIIMNFKINLVLKK